MHACVVMLQVSCPYYLATWLLWQDGSGSLLDRPDFAEPARGALEAMTPPAETPKCPDLSCSGMPAWVMFSTWKLTFIKKVCSCMDGCMHRFFLCNIFDQRCKLSGIHACTHAEVEGTAGENSISDCVSNMQPIPSAAPVLVDLGQEDRFGQSNQGQFLESVRHDIYSKKRQHLKSLTKNIYYICLRTSWSPTRTARSVVRSGGAQCRVHTCAVFRFMCLGSRMWPWQAKAVQWHLPAIGCDEHREYKADRNASCICRCSSFKVTLATIAKQFCLPVKHSWITTITCQGKQRCAPGKIHWSVQSWLRDEPVLDSCQAWPSTLHAFHACEFLQAHVRSWKPPESEETKAAKAAERAEKAKQKKKVKKEKEENHGADVKSEDDSVEPKCRPWHVTSDKH